MSWLSKILRDKSAAGPDGDARNEPAAEAVDSRPPSPEILATLRKSVARVATDGGRTLDETVIRDDVDLYEAGYLDSISASAFLVLAEKAYGVQLPDWLLGGPTNTLEKLARYIEGESSAGRGR